MKKKMQKIAIFTVIIYSFMLPHVNAGIVSTGEEWLAAGKQGNIDLGKNIADKVSDLSGLLFALGIAIAVIVTAILGIQFMLTASSDSKADVKKKAIIVAVGICVLVASVSIWQIIVGVLSSTT